MNTQPFESRICSDGFSFTFFCIFCGGCEGDCSSKESVPPSEKIRITDCKQNFFFFECAMVRSLYSFSLTYLPPLKLLILLFVSLSFEVISITRYLLGSYSFLLSVTKLYQSLPFMPKVSQVRTFHTHTNVNHFISTVRAVE